MKAQSSKFDEQLWEGNMIEYQESVGVGPVGSQNESALHGHDHLSLTAAQAVLFSAMLGGLIWTALACMIWLV